MHLLMKRKKSRVPSVLDILVVFSAFGVFFFVVVVGGSDESYGRATGRPVNSKDLALQGETTEGGNLEGGLSWLVDGFSSWQGQGRNVGSSDRLFLIRPSGYIHAGSLSVPGHYTIVTFSAEWCLPCTKLREEAPEWLRLFPNLAIVDVDIGSEGEVGGMESAILGDILEDRGTLPAALLFNPYGLYTNRQPGQGMAPVVGYSAIKNNIERGFSKRKYRDVLPMDAESAFKRLRAMQSRGQHYAKRKAEGGSGSSNFSRSW